MWLVRPGTDRQFREVFDYVTDGYIHGTVLVAAGYMQAQDTGVQTYLLL